jgi:predicted TIM-barrel enzyme
MWGSACTGEHGCDQRKYVEICEYADGVIVGSSPKVDGYTWNPVDSERIARIVTALLEIHWRIGLEGSSR